MKLNETLLSTPLIDTLEIEETGNSHIAGSYDTPLRADAFSLSDDKKIQLIAENFRNIMETLGLDISDDSLRGTPQRVAKMYVKEWFSGLNPANKPQATLFDNHYKYAEMLIEKNISFHSCCEHHFVPIVGKAHVSYISSGKVIGLSKLNRIVRFFARRPQVQERLTVQIGKELQQILATESVAVLIDAKHLCVSSRGVEDHHSSTITSFFGGKFQEDNTRAEFIKLVN